MTPCVTCFWVGTVAELIKLFPIMHHFNSLNAPYTIFSTGQNNIKGNELLALLEREPQIVVTNAPNKPGMFHFFIWFLRSFFLAFVKIPKAATQKNRRSNLVVHVDTVSTLIGAVIGWMKGYRVCHVEAGLRSFNWLHPFPEELDRVVVSRFADVHFCPNSWALGNIKHLSGDKIDTQGNTLMDSLKLSCQIDAHQSVFKDATQEKYFILVIHRQENLMNKDFLSSVVSMVSKKMVHLKCVFVLHKTTQDALHKFGLISQVQENKNFVCTERLSYFAFMALLKSAKFIITDGGSNQEECYYLGLPTLILRKVTERTEGLGHNVVLYNGDLNVIPRFFDSVESLRRDPIDTKHSPSALISQWLLEN